MSNFADVMRIAAGIESPEDIGLASFDELDVSVDQNDETVILEGETVGRKVDLDPVKVEESIKASAAFFSNTRIL